MSKTVTSDEIRKSVSMIVKDKDKEDQIISLFWDLDAYNFFLEKEGVLEVLTEYIKNNPDFTRNEFYSFYIGKVTSDFQDGLLDLLRKVAVAMELLQRNDLSVKELSEVLKDFTIKDENLVTELFDNEVACLGGKDRKFSFKHHTIQEFLASQYIEMQVNPIDEFKKYAVLELDCITAIKNSWYGVIRFLLEGRLAQDVLQVLLNIASDDKSNINEQFVDSLTSFDPKSITKKQQQELFYLMFNTYLEKAIWLPIWASKNIWRIAPQEALQIIRDLFDQKITNVKQAVNVGNAIPIISGILEHKPDYIEATDYWKTKFIKFAHESKGYGVVQRRSFDALEYFKDDKEVLEKIRDVMDDSKKKLVRDALIETAYTILPNSQITMDLLVKAYKRGNSIKARYGLYEITEKKAFDYFLKQLIKHEAFRSKFLEDSSVFRSERDDRELNLIKKIEKFSKNKDTLTLLKDLFKTSYQHKSKYRYISRTTFLPEIAQVIAKQELGYIFELIKELQEESTDDPVKAIWEFEQVIPYFFTKGNAVKLAKTIKEVDPEKTFVLQRILYGLKNDKIKDGEAMFKIMVDKKFVSSSQEEDTTGKKKEDNIYKQFKTKLEPKKGKFSPDVFQLYLNNKEHLESRILPKDRKRMKDLIINTVLEKWDPKTIKVTIKGRNDQGGTGQYTITSFSPVYGDALRVAEVLLSKKEVKPYRGNIICYIPFAYSQEQQAIVNILNKVTDDEFKELNAMYLDQSSDKRYFMPSAYVYIVKSLLKNKSKLPSSKQILLSFIEDERIEKYAKLESIEALESLIDEDDKLILEDVFTKLHKSEDDYERRTREYANKILIDKFKDKSAIKWRFDQIMKRAEPFVIPEGGHSVSDIEDETHTLKFASSIITLNDQDFIPDVLKLLDKSFELMAKPSEGEQNNYRNYVNYMWQIAIAFFENLSKKKNVKHFLMLSKHYAEGDFKDNWFQFKLDSLRNVYINAVGTPSISVVNELIDGTK